MIRLSLSYQGRFSYGLGNEARSAWEGLGELSHLIAHAQSRRRGVPGVDNQNPGHKQRGSTGSKGKLMSTAPTISEIVFTTSPSDFRLNDKLGRLI